MILCFFPTAAKKRKSDNSSFAHKNVQGIAKCFYTCSKPLQKIPCLQLVPFYTIETYVDKIKFKENLNPIRQNPKI